MFSFSFRRNNNLTEIYWEKNDWYRKHGYSLPLDTYFILQWISLIILDICFFGFLAQFVSSYESHHDTIKAEWNEFQNWVENPLMTWNTLVMFGLSLVVKILSVTTSMIDTEDEIVKKQQIPRSQTYLKRFGMPVVDSFTGICNICRVKV